MHGGNEGFCNGLMCCLLQAFVDQLSRNSNPQYDYGELNLCLALAYMVNHSVYGFVAGKLGFILMQHTIIIFASNRTPPFINLTSYEAFESLCGDLIRVNQAMGNLCTNSLFTVVIDATNVVTRYRFRRSNFG